MTIGKALVTFGVVVVVIGLLLQLAPNLQLGRLPGDVTFGGKNWRVFLPLGTSLLLSVILTLVFSLINAYARR